MDGWYSTQCTQKTKNTSLLPVQYAVLHYKISRVPVVHVYVRVLLVYRVPELVTPLLQWHDELFHGIQHNLACTDAMDCAVWCPRFASLTLWACSQSRPAVVPSHAVDKHRSDTDIYG